MSISRRTAIAIPILTVVAGLSPAALLLTPAHAAQAQAPSSHSAPQGGPAAPQTGTRPVVDLPWWTTRPCPSEDSVNCRWIANGPNAQGNGRGHTFVVRQVPGKKHMVCVFYVLKRDAKRWDYCS